MNKRTIQTFGTIIKKEQLASVENSTGGQALILESLQPFPGYHGTTIPDRLEPDSLFAVTSTMYSEERILRAIQAVKKVYPIHFNAAPGSLFLKNNPVNVIRFRCLSYNAIAELIGYFKEMGIDFAKDKKVAPYECIIRINKFFKMEEIHEGVFMDSDNAETFYIEVPVQMDWNTFEQVSNQIKYNIEDNNYDAAQASVYNENGLLDLIRIYDQDCSPDKVLYIRNNYLEAISKI